MPKKPDPAGELAAKLIQTLQALRAEGGGAYPTTLARLLERADPDVPAEVKGKAAGKQPFLKQTVTARKKDLAAPIALDGDAGLLAADPRTLEYALETLYASGPPPWPIKKLSGKLEKVLRPPFEAAVARRVAENALPESVGVVGIGGKTPALYLKRQPPPPPPHKELAERLINVLEAQRRLSPEFYPVRLTRLVELTGIAASAKLLAKARKEPPFAAGAVSLIPKHKDPLMALASAVDEAAGRPQVLEFLLEWTRGGAPRAVSTTDLKAALDKRAQAPFAEALARRMESGALPPDVGWIDAGTGKKAVRLLFRLQDVHAATSPPRGAHAAPPADRGADPAPPDPAAFDAAFDAAFARLDHARGSYNSVSLDDLRRALPFDRAAFDAHLRRLRAARRYGLSALEGHIAPTAEQRAAGVMEEGSLLVFVSRRNP